GETRLLAFSELAHPVMGEGNIGFELGRDLSRCGLDGSLRDLDVSGIAIELFAVGARDWLATLLDVLQHRGHPALRLVFARLRRHRCLLQIANGHGAELSM